MKICLDVSQVVFEGTGAATYTSELVKSLLEQDLDNEYQMFGASLRRRSDLTRFQKSLSRKLNSAFVPIPPSVLHLLWNTIHKIPVETFVGNVDIFHTSDATQPPAKRARLVTTVHDLVYLHFPETLHPAQVKVQKLRMEWVKKEAAQLIAVSESTKQDLVDLLKIEPGRITVVYEGVSDIYRPSLRYDSQKIAAVRQKYGLNQTYLLNVGTLQPRKNLLRLLEAYKTMHNIPQLAVAGNLGWGNELPRVDRVKLIGFVDAMDLPYLYAGATAFIYPSLYEGFGLPILEAMACGTPVVTSNTSSLAEIADGAAILVDPHDSASIVEGIDMVLSLDEAAYNDRQRKGIVRAAQFTWQKTARQTLGVYNAA